MTENIARQIKHHIYGKAQRIKAIFQPGFGETAFNETLHILNHAWFPQKFKPDLSLLKHEIRIDNIHFVSAVELLMRSLCLADIRLIIAEGKMTSKLAFQQKCSDIHWAYFLNKEMRVKIKVDSIASKLFHETALKQIASDIVKQYVSTIETGDNTTETTTIFIEFIKNKLTISISLAGQPLYKRGYKTLTASAPLREDIASCCMARAMEFANQIKPNFQPDLLLIPFSGTGTFAFEYLLRFSAPVLLSRNYALKKMPLFRKENFQFLLKKAQENLSQPQLHFICIDTSQTANNAMEETLLQNQFFQKKLFTIHKSDFIKATLSQFLKNEQTKNIFIPLNPPYGIRLGKEGDPSHLYKNIAKKLNELKNKSITICGFILCPDTKTWSAFVNYLAAEKKETYHFTQGGLDIRVCQFII